MNKGYTTLLKTIATCVVLIITSAITVNATTHVGIANPIIARNFFATFLRPSQQNYDQPAIDLGGASYLMSAEGVVLNQGSHEITIIDTIITSQRIFLIADIYAGQMINVDDIKVTLTLSQDIVDNNIHNRNTIDIALIDTDWNVSLQNGLIVIEADFSATDIERIDIHDIGFLTITSEQLDTLVLIDLPLINYLRWDPTFAWSIRTPLEHAMTLHLTDDVFLDAMGQYFAPINETITYDDTTINIYNTLALLSHNNLTVYTFFSIQSDALDTQNIWGNRIGFTQVEPYLHPSVINALYYDQHTNKVYFAKTSWLQTSVGYNTAYMPISLDITGIYSGADLIIIEPDINLGMIVGNHTPTWLTEPTLYVDLPHTADSAWSAINVTDDVKIGTLVQNELNISLGYGAYISNIALHGNLLYIQYAWLPTGNEMWFNLDRHISAWEEWRPQFMHHYLTTDDTGAYLVVEEVWWMQDPTALDTIVLSGAKETFGTIATLDAYGTFYAPVVPSLSKFIPEQIVVPVGYNDFTLYDFAIFTAHMYFSIYEWQDFNEIWNIDNEDPIFMVEIILDNGTEYAVIETTSICYCNVRSWFFGGISIPDPETGAVIDLSGLMEVGIDAINPHHITSIIINGIRLY